MPERHATIQVEPGSELDHLLETVDDAEILLEKGGQRYRLNRVDRSVADRDSHPRRKPLEPARVLEIIGLGESAEGSNIARDKDRYLADATDHRGG